MTNTAPVFIVGAPRSGTTILRDTLRLDDRFLCPEETHFFRWNEAYGSTYYRDLVAHNATLLHHRELDGVLPDEFNALLDRCEHKGQLWTGYMQLLAQKRDLQATVIPVDKTPQHVYALELIHHYFPQARFVHIVRNPLNVVSSLMKGRQFDAQDLVGALNFWLEPIELMERFRARYSSQCAEVSYELFAEDPDAVMTGLYRFLNIAKPTALDTSEVHPAPDRHSGFLGAEHIDYIVQRAAAAGRVVEPV